MHAGTYKPDGEDVCLLCAPGTYNPKVGAVSAEACKRCPGNATFSNLPGATTCAACPSQAAANDNKTGCECVDGVSLFLDAADPLVS